MFDWILKHLFGSNWRQNLQSAFSIAAESYFAGRGAAVTRQQVQAWMSDHVTSIASEMAAGNPVYAAMLAGAAEAFIPQLIGSVTDYVEEHAIGAAAAKAIEQQAGSGAPGTVPLAAAAAQA